MIQITKSGNTATALFTGSDFYLYGEGQIVFPVGSLSVVIDESDFVTFRKAPCNDVLFSAPMSQVEIDGTALTRENAPTLLDSIIGTPSGGDTPASGYVTTGEFNSFVENSAVTKDNFNTVLEASQGWGAHNTAITSLSGNVNTLSGQVTANTSNIATISGAVTGKQDTLTAGSGISIDNNVISVTGGTPASGYVTTEELEESELVTAAALNDLNTRVGTVSGNVTTLSGTVSGNSSDISTISGQVTANTSDITSLSGQIGDIATALSAIVGE